MFGQLARFAAQILYVITLNDDAQARVCSLRDMNSNTHNNRIK